MWWMCNETPWATKNLHFLKMVSCDPCDGENCEDHEDGDCEVMRNHDVGDDDQEALIGVAAEARLRISTVPIYQPARNVTLLASI